MKRFSRMCAYLLLTVAAVMALYPFILMVLGSVKTPVELSANPGGWPIDPTLQNYIDLFNYNGGTLQRAYLNSIFITATHLAIATIITSLAAYAFSKLTFKGRNVLFLCLLGTMMVPAEILLPPLYLIFSKIKWINTYQVQIIPGVANVFGLFLLRQYMRGIHDSILESARIDGMNEFGVFRSIVLPVSAPALGAFLVLQGLSKWNDFLWPAMLVNNLEYQPIMVVLPLLSNGSNSIFSTPWTLEMAGCTIATLPIFILFLIFQDKIMQSVTLGSIKE